MLGVLCSFLVHAWLVPVDISLSLVLLQGPVHCSLRLLRCCVNLKPHAPGTVAPRVDIQADQKL